MCHKYCGGSIRYDLNDMLVHAHIRNGENYSHMIRDGNYDDWDMIEICKCICDSVEEYWLEKIDKNRYERSN